jgi:hypothetical protein
MGVAEERRMRKRRIISVLAVMAMVAAMVAAMAMPAFADHPRNDTAPNCEGGTLTAFDSGLANKSEEAKSRVANIFFDKCP